MFSSGIPNIILLMYLLYYYSSQAKDFVTINFDFKAVFSDKFTLLTTLEYQCQR